MSQLNFLCCFLFVIVVEGVYHQREKLSRCIIEDTICEKRPIYYCDSYKNYRRLCPRRCRACRSQTRNTMRSRHTDDYQRQGPPGPQTDDIEEQLGREFPGVFQHQAWIKPGSNYEEVKSFNYNLREDAQQSTDSRRARNNEKGPGSNYGTPISGTYVYHTRDTSTSNGNVKRDNQKSTRGDRNYEKDPRTSNTRSRTDEYQRRASPSGNIGQQSSRTGYSYTKLKTTDFLQQDRLQSLASTAKYEGCRDRGLFCRYWKHIGCCEKPLGRRLCSRTCGFCSPMNPVCPRSYKFGCCWNGEPARDPEKKSCMACVNLSEGICSRRQAVYRDCDLYSANTMKTRALCPQTCGACFDYSTYA